MELLDLVQPQIVSAEIVAEVLAALPAASTPQAAHAVVSQQPAAVLSLQAAAQINANAIGTVLCTQVV